jgi:hypothetical protein
MRDSGFVLYLGSQLHFGKKSPASQMREQLSLHTDLLYPIFALAFCSFLIINRDNAKQHSALSANRNKAR